MKLYVGNLSFETTETGLQDAFERFGSVTDTVVMMDRTTNRSRGFGFVTMSSDAEGKAAIDGLHGNALDGRNLTVNEARPREDRPQKSFSGSRRY
jgi:RNA recognition motif-containing protein